MKGAPLTQSPPGSRKILIVDDEPMVADTLELIFSTRGYDVQSANSAEEAIEMISQWRPDLAILDVMLPQMNGIELGIALKANYPDCLVLLLSGHPSAGELLGLAKERGHDFDILAKPFHPSFILDTVAAMLPASSWPAEA
jgi:DNA-binding response OmpR family regulator